MTNRRAACAGFVLLAAMSFHDAPSGRAWAQPLSAQDSPAQAIQDPPAPGNVPAEPPKPQRLSGKQAWSTLIGNSATGKTSEGMRTDYYGADGSIKTLMDSELKTGKWRLQNERICIEYPSPVDEEEEAEGETCYRITITGSYVVFVDDDGGGWRLRILPGNPKDL